MLKIFKKFFKNKAEIEKKKCIQMYPVKCIHENKDEFCCEDCIYRNTNSCSCKEEFKEKISSTIGEWVAYDNDFRGIRTYDDYIRKMPIAYKRKLAKVKKYEAKKQMLLAGATYLVALELCKEVGLDIKDIEANVWKSEK